MQQISPVELYKRLKSDETQPLLLDVRDPHEFGYCHIEGSINIPMNRIFAGPNGLDPEQETVVICHHGIRSAQVANYLMNRGFKRISNLQGGIASWASDVDPAMPTY